MVLKASVIIPAYNAENAIGNCLKALGSQTRRPAEIIVVDDGSSDKTCQVAEAFDGVKVVRQKNRGPASARNKGASNARGDILLFTDADCVPDKRWVENMLKPFSDKDVVGAQGTYKTKQQSLMARFSQAEIEDRYRMMVKKKSIDFIGTYSAGYRKSVFMKFSGFDESFPKASGEDPELSFRMSQRGHGLVFAPSAVVYHTHPDSLGKYLRQKYWRAYWRVLLYKKHPEKAIKDSYTPQTLKLQIALFYVLLVSMVLCPIIGLLPAAAVLILLIIAGIPFSARSSNIGADVAILSPIILVLRSAVFGVGLFIGKTRG